jgi:hypothetical protein
MRNNRNVTNTGTFVENVYHNGTQHGIGKGNHNY